MTATERITFTKLTQKQAAAAAARHEMLYAGRMGGARAVFAFCDLSGLDLAGRNLADADFTGAILEECNFAGARLESASFFSADLRRANLAGASLRRADLRGALLRGANLIGADLYEADMREGTIAEKDRYGNLRILQHDVGPTELPSALLTSANLERARMTGVFAVQADFTDAMMRGCRLARANLRQAKLNGANLENADLSGCDLKGAELHGAILIGACMTRAVLDGVDLSTALTEAPCGREMASLPVPIEDMLDAHSRWVETDGRDGQPVDLSGMDLRKLKSLAHRALTALIAPGATLYGLNLEGALLQGSNLQGCDLRRRAPCGRRSAGRQSVRRQAQQCRSARCETRAAADLRFTPAAGTSRGRAGALRRFPRRRFEAREAVRSGPRLCQSERRRSERCRSAQRHPHRRQAAGDPDRKSRRPDAEEHRIKPPSVAHFVRATFPHKWGEDKKSSEPFSSFPPLVGGRWRASARRKGARHERFALNGFRAKIASIMRFILVALVLLSASTAQAAPAALDALFGKLAKAPSAEAAKPIEQEILTAFLQSGSASVDLLMTRTAALLEAKDSDNAAKVLDAVTNIAPGYAEGWHQLGKLEAGAGHDEAAMVALQKTVTLNPRQFAAQMELGDLLAEYGAKPAALASYKKALALDPHLEGLEHRVQQLSREVEGEKI